MSTRPPEFDPTFGRPTAIDDAFTSKLQGLEARVAHLQSRWSDTQKRADAVLAGLGDRVAIPESRPVTAAA